MTSGKLYGDNRCGRCGADYMDYYLLPSPYCTPSKYLDAGQVIMIPDMVSEIGELLDASLG